MMNNEEYINDDPFTTEKIVHVLDKWNASKVATRETNSFKDYVELTEAENEIARIFKNQGSSDGLNKSIIHFLLEKEFKEKHNEEHEYFTERKVLVEKIQKWLDRSPLFKLNLTSKRWECYYGDGKDAKILWDKVLTLRFAWSLQDSSKKDESVQLRLESFKEVIRLANPGSTVGQLTQKLCSMLIIPYSLDLLAECDRIVKIIEYEPKDDDDYLCKAEENQTEEKENGVEQVTKVNSSDISQKAECKISEMEENKNTSLAGKESLRLQSESVSPKKKKELEQNYSSEVLCEKIDGKERFMVILKKSQDNGNQGLKEFRADVNRSSSSFSIHDQTDDDSSDEDIFSSSVTQALEKSAAMTSEFEEPRSPIVSPDAESKSSGVPDSTTSIGLSVISPIVIPDDMPQKPTSGEESFQISQSSATGDHNYVIDTKKAADDDTKTNLSPPISPKSSATECEDSAESLSMSSSETLSAPSSPQREFKKTAGLELVPGPSLLIQDKPQSITICMSSSNPGSKNSAVSNIIDMQKQNTKEDQAEQYAPVELNVSMTSLLKFTLNFDHFPTSYSIINLANRMKLPWTQIRDWFNQKRQEKRENGFHLHNKVLKFCPYCNNHWPFNNKELGRQHLYTEEHVKKVLQIEQETLTASSPSLEPNTEKSVKEDIHSNKTLIANSSSDEKTDQIIEDKENTPVEAKCELEKDDSRDYRKPLYGPWNMASIIDLAQRTLSEVSSQSHVECPLCFAWISVAQNLQRHLIERHLNKIPNSQKNIVCHKIVPTKLVCSSSTVNKGIQKQNHHKVSAKNEKESSKEKMCTIDNAVMKALGFSSAENESSKERISSTIDNVIMQALGFSSVSDLPSTSQEKVEAGGNLNDSRSNISDVKWKSPKGASPSPGKRKKSFRRVSKGGIPTPAECELLIKPLQQGWVREVVYRGTVDENASKKWDVYYRPPVGKKLRSNVEIGKYLDQKGIQDLTVKNFDYSFKCLGENVINEHIRSASATKPFAKNKHGAESLHNETPVYYDELSYLLSSPSNTTDNKSPSVTETLGVPSTDQIKKPKKLKKNVDGAKHPPLAGARAVLVAKALEAAKSSDDTLVVPFNDLETHMDCADDIGIENETGEMTGFETWHTPSWDKQNDKEQPSPSKIKDNSGVSPEIKKEQQNENEQTLPSKMNEKSGVSPEIKMEPKDNINISSVLLHPKKKKNTDKTPYITQDQIGHDNISSVSDTHTQISLTNTPQDKPKIRIKSMFDLQDLSGNAPDTKNKPLTHKALSSLFQFDNQTHIPTVSSVQINTTNIHSGGVKKVAVLTGLGSPPKGNGSISPVKVISASMHNNKKSSSNTCSHLNLEDIPFEEEVINDSTTDSTNDNAIHDSESSNDSCNLNLSVGKRKRSDDDDLPESKKDKMPKEISLNLRHENYSFKTKTDIIKTYKNTKKLETDVNKNSSTIGDTFFTGHIVSQSPSIRNQTLNEMGLETSTENSDRVDIPDIDCDNDLINNAEILSNNDKQNSNYDIVDLSDTENDDSVTQNNNNNNNNIIELSDSENEDNGFGFFPIICAVRGGKEVEDEFHHDLNDEPSIVQDLDSSNSNTINEDIVKNQSDPPPLNLWMDKDKGEQQGHNIVSSIQIPFTTVSQSRPVFTNASTSDLTTTTSKIPSGKFSFIIPSSQQSTSNLQLPLSLGQITVNLQNSLATPSTVVTKTFQPPMVSNPNVSPNEKNSKIRAIMPKNNSFVSNILTSPLVSATVHPTFNPTNAIQQESNLSSKTLTSEEGAITPTFKPINTVDQQQPQMLNHNAVVDPQQESNIHVQQPILVGQQSQIAQVVQPINSQGQSNQVLNSGTLNYILQQPVNQVVQQPVIPQLQQPVNPVLISQPINQVVQQPICQMVQQPVMQMSQQSVNQIPQHSVGQILLPVRINQPGQIITRFSSNANQGQQQIQNLPQQTLQMNQIGQNPQVLRVIKKSDGSLVLPQSVRLQWSPQSSSPVVRVSQPNQQNLLGQTNQQGIQKQVIRIVQQPSSQIIQQQQLNVGSIQPSGNQLPQQKIIVAKQSAPQVAQQQNVKNTEQSSSSTQTQVAKVTLENTLSLDDFVSHLFSS